MKTPSDNSESLNFLSDGEEMGALTREFDWSGTSLGNAEQWPQNLRFIISMVLTSKFPMIIWWGEDLIQFYNDAFRKSLGVNGKHPKALGQKAEECWPESWEIVLPLIKRVRENRESIEMEDKLIAIFRNGQMEDVYWTFSYSPIFGNSREVDGVLVVCSDTTEKIKARKVLEENEARFKTMAEATDILISVADNKMNSTYFSKAWVNLTGRSEDELLNLGWADLVQPDDREILLNNYRRALEKKESFVGEFRILDKEGNYRWLLAKVPAIYHPDGSHAGYVSSCVDITEIKKSQIALQESEKNLRKTILNAPVAMGIFKGPDFIVELANKKMFEFWGKSADQVMNKPIFQVVPDVKDQKVFMDKVFLTGNTVSVEDVQIDLKREDKSETVHVNFLYEAYHDAEGEISGVIKVAIDVTTEVIARKKIEEVVNTRTKELAEAVKKLQLSNAELAQFAYIASHDLQEPLRKIRMFSQMLDSKIGKNLDEKSKNYLTKIQSSSFRMHNLIRDVLTYSELANETDIFKPVDLNEILKLTINDYELLIEEKNSTFEFDQLPTIEASPLQMSQIFGNIISNALKYSRPDVNPIVKISSQKLNKEEKDKLSLNRHQDYYKIQIADNGIGFKDKHKEQIFDIFKRLHGKLEYSGTGIGLAMCKKIVLNHHGHINANGSSENGAVFNIILPIKQPKVPEKNED